MKSARRVSPLVFWGLFAGLAGGLLIALLLARQQFGDSIPSHSLPAYLNAVDRWNEQAPQDFDLQVEVRGSQPATYFVQVRNGEARSAFRNGSYLPQLRSHETWSVDGMFATLAQDVARLEEAEQANSNPPFSLRVDFDSQYGYPAHYRRSEYDFPIEVQWDVVLFEPREEGAEWGEQLPEEIKKIK